MSDVLVFDANGDQHADVIFVAAAADGVWNQNNGTLHTLLGDGQGGLRAGPSRDVGMWGWRFSVTAADYDEDGYTDVVVAVVRSRGGNESLEFPRIMFGSEDAGFSEPVAVPPTEASAEVYSVDYDGDGHIDLITSGVEGAIHVYTGRGDGSFGAPIGFAVGREPYWFTTLDFDRGDNPDLLAVTAKGLERVVLPPRAEALDAPRVYSFIVKNACLYAAFPPSVVDFDGDADGDVVCAHPRGALALLNDGAAGFRALDVVLYTDDDPFAYSNTLGSPA